LKKDIQTLENRIKFINIFLMPILVCLFGILISIAYTRGYKHRLARKLQATS
jgi:hypothetical protein